MSTEAQEPKRSRRKVKSRKKLPMIPSSAKVHKRPLFHPQIPSPYAGASQLKVVYIRPSTPFISAVNRVRGLLKQIDKRSAQSVAHQTRKDHGDKILAQARIGISEASEEEVTVKGTGRAIEKVLGVAAWFQDAERNEGTQVRLCTSSVTAIDDIIVDDELDPAAGGNEQDDDNEELQETRMRQVSVLEAKISLR